ncbi:hypothetical protein ACFVAJ_17480 [Agromyces sp. NPDC057679]|uniref:hypothetical protein n=1 Tax=Agromyces sp. NPDC057679 TaxID=3346207 RepID=UPI00366EB2AB
MSDATQQERFWAASQIAENLAEKRRELAKITAPLAYDISQMKGTLQHAVADLVGAKPWEVEIDTVLSCEVSPTSLCVYVDRAETCHFCFGQRLRWPQPWPG